MDMTRMKLWMSAEWEGREGQARENGNRGEKGDGVVRGRRRGVFRAVGGRCEVATEPQDSWHQNKPASRHGAGRYGEEQGREGRGVEGKREASIRGHSSS